jgi:transcriptional regulator with XRE-family HTH domain
MADNFNVPQPEYSKIEKGKRNLTLKQAIFLAGLLKINVCEILDFGDAKNQFIEYFNTENQHIIIDLQNQNILLLSKIEELTIDKKMQFEHIKTLQKLIKKK